MKNIFVVTVDCYSLSDEVPKPLNHISKKGAASKNRHCCFLFTTKEEKDIEENEFNFFFPDWVDTYSKFIERGQLLIRHISFGIYREEHAEEDKEDYVRNNRLTSSCSLYNIMLKLPFEWISHKNELELLNPTNEKNSLSNPLSNNIQ